MVAPEFMQGLRELCDQYDTVLICDEIQCGYGRSGKFFAHQYTGIRPDVITVAKGIANGAPMGAFMAKKKYIGTTGKNFSVYNNWNKKTLYFKTPEEKPTHFWIYFMLKTPGKAHIDSVELKPYSGAEKPAAAVLNPGEAWSCTLSTSFVR